MGLPSIVMNIPKFFAINLISILKFVVIAALSQLGLLKNQQQEPTSDYEDEGVSYVYLIDRRCPIPVPVSVDILIAIIKKKLVVKKFSSDGDEGCVCSVCLDCIENADEIRELCNCNHVFHKDCLDNWVDLGRITCPLCRSMLFPDNLLVAERKTLLAAADLIVADN
ncbi:RING/U-box superfamily protein [Euphorbia peplus]|nr:RING/U-box superfamily protein [Euphorbia peplus]